MPPPEIEGPEQFADCSSPEFISNPDNRDIAKKPSKVNKQRAGFFAINAESWEKVCGHGDMFIAAAYLVLASGAWSKDHRTTTWSGKSLRKLGIGNTNTDALMARLIAIGAIEKIDNPNSSRPLHRLTWPEGDPNLIWLPASLIDGVATEMPPIKLLMQTRNLDAARLLIRTYELYDPMFDGVDPSIISEKYNRRRKPDKSYAEWEVWAFSKMGTFSGRGDPLKLIDADSAAAAGSRIEAARQVLSDLGLIEVVPTVIDDATDAGGALHAYDTSDTQEILSILEDNHLIDDEWRENYKDNELVALRRHIKNPWMAGIIRPRYRPHTEIYQEGIAAMAEGRRHNALFQPSPPKQAAPPKPKPTPIDRLPDSYVSPPTHTPRNWYANRPRSEFLKGSSPHEIDLYCRHRGLDLEEVFRELGMDVEESLRRAELARKTVPKHVPDWARELGIDLGLS